jgi:hypothetical protein
MRIEAIAERSAFYPRPRRTETGLGRLPVLVSLVRRCADCSSGLAPDLCSRGVRPLRTLSEGAGGFLPGVPFECLDTGDHHLHGPSPRFVELTNPTRESNARHGGGVPGVGPAINHGLKPHWSVVHSIPAVLTDRGLAAAMGQVQTSVLSSGTYSGSPARRKAEEYSRQTFSSMNIKRARSLVSVSSGSTFRTSLIASAAPSSRPFRARLAARNRSA